MADQETRELLVIKDDGKQFRVRIGLDDKVTFGPFSPPTKGGFGSQDRAVGTLRIYRKTKENIIACFAGVRGFRDLSLDYMEEIIREEGATIWKSDEHGYMREEKQTATKDWIEPVTPAIAVGNGTKSSRKKT